MALSGSTDFGLNRDQLIQMALRDINVLASGETADSQELTDASLALNSMVKSWVADGMQLWVLKTQLHSLTADTQSYTIGLTGNIAIPRPDKLDSVIYRNADGTYDRPLERLTRSEYYSLSAKQSKGVPVSFYYDPQLTNGVLYLWPYPLTVTTEKILIIYQKPFDDLDTSTDDFEFPPWYYEAIRWNLAENLAHSYGIPAIRYSMIKAKAREEKQRVMEYDQEQGSIFFEPESRFYNGL